MDADVRIAATARALELAARDAGYWISGDGRIGESDLADLLGWEPASLARRRAEGTSPAFYRISGRGSRVSYRLDDVAVWLEAHRTATGPDGPGANELARDSEAPETRSVDDTNNDKGSAVRSALRGLGRGHP